ncbi:uncharacterized protein LOC107614918 [Arachis ipaensis]|uniref:uncharacterized protein LOC107614918 n=1 Tax=Arachis ipaensis TaxID=130454 RepID=UPI0007AEFF3B|nr:uncharacterized protein LOC107614918 [Arachis ipaensis]
MKTPPNSEDELQSDEDSDEFPIFRNGARFGELHLQVGMKFNTKAVCKVQECAWVVYASRDCDDSYWQIKTFNDDHTYARENTNRAANMAWVTSKLVKKVRKYPNFKQCEAAVYFRTKCDFILNRNSIARALADARNVVYGDEKAQYAKLRDYDETLLKTNPGSTVQICVEPQPNGDVIFDKMYVCLHGFKMGFKAGCRPLIGLDGTFLKTQFGGQILAAVAQDANHHIYVIAWAIVEIENTDTWKWFLEMLHADLEDYKTNGWCFISDMQKDFIDNLNKIKRVNEEAWAYLNKWPRESWTKSQFSHRPKLDNICNNACEVFNARIKEAKSKPIITLLEEVRMFVMRTIAKDKVKLANHVGILPPVIQSCLDKIKKESKNWMPIWTSDEDYEKFEVHGHSTNMVVDLGKRLCTCQFWMLTGIPCVHACAALARVNKRPEDFCHQLCTMEAYNKTYTHHINSLPGQSLWEKSMYTQPQAPNIRRRPGALTKKRRKDADEGNSGIVGVKGHTKRGCSKKRLDEVVAAVAATKAAADKAKSNDAASASEAGPQPHTTAAPADKPSAVEIDISQPNYEGSQDIAGSAAPAPSRPHKLPTKRRSSPPPQSIGVDPI